MAPEKMAPEKMKTRRLYRSRQHRMIAGVVGGVAEYFDVDPTVLRVIWVVGSLLLPPMLLADVLIYIAMVIIVPGEPLDR
jgi:phage shock protein C